jgi:drug/metabolite transporter (DMT)-like permease
MSGSLWAIAAGVGFGLFQTLNRRAVERMDVFFATFLQLSISAVVLIAVSVATQDLNLLWQASPAAWLYFSAAGLLHFFIGWTFLNASQKRIGAARTSALIGTSPLFAAAVSLVTLGEGLTWTGILGIVLIVAGVVITSMPFSNGKTEGSGTDKPGAGWVAMAIALAAPLCWSISPTFTRLGLDGLHSPLLGVTVGMTASSLCYGVAFALRRSPISLSEIGREALTYKIAAGVLVGLSTWMRWIALDMVQVAQVLALSLASVPTVNILTPFVVDKKVEQVTARVWGGSALIVAGSLVLILT